MITSTISASKETPIGSTQCKANFVSSLQKANQSQKSKHSRWLEQCYEFVIPCHSINRQYTIPIDGGSDAGMFCVVGAHFDLSFINVGDTTKIVKTIIKPGDIILAVNGYEISGYTKRDAVTLCNIIMQYQPEMRLHLSPPHALATGSTMLSSFLASTFSMDSPEYNLQERIRENVYQRVVPCTTRLPRPDEVKGVHYHFMTVPQFLALEQSGQLLESGVYKGNHYGTPRPDPNSTALDLLHSNQTSSNPMESSQISDDVCQIPPALPPLSSLAATTLVAHSINQSFESTHQCIDAFRAVSRAPPPPVRNSSIINQLILDECGESADNVKNFSNLKINSRGPSGLTRYPPLLSNNFNGDVTTINTVGVDTTATTTIPTSTTTTDDGDDDNDKKSNNDSNSNNNINAYWRLSNNKSSPALPISTSSVVTMPASIVNNAYGNAITNNLIANDIRCNIGDDENHATTINADNTLINNSALNGLDNFYDQTAYSVDHLDQSGECVLPYGWEIVQDPKYGTFYIDHINKHTQYEPPSMEDFQTAELTRINLVSELQTINTATTTSENRCLNATPQFTQGKDASSVLFNDTSRTHHDNNAVDTLGRVSPSVFTTDLTKLKGPLINTTLVKSSRGFGFTIIGGSDSNLAAFLQVKHIIPGGPACLNSCLAVGDVVVSVDGKNVLGYTHAQLVSLFQSIPIGLSVNLLVSQGYCLKRDSKDFISVPTDSIQPADHNLLIDSSSMQPHQSNSNTDNINYNITSNVVCTTSDTRQLILTSTPVVVSQPSTGQQQFTSQNRSTQRPEFLKISIKKQLNGFGFTLADHIQGQHVKAISDPVRCGRLRVGDVLVEINDQRVKEMPHVEVVQILKECPVGQDARLLMQRGGLYTDTITTLDSEQCGLISLDLKDYESYPTNHRNVNNGPQSQVNTSDFVCTTPQPQRGFLNSHPAHESVCDTSLSSESSSRVRAQTPDPSLDRQLGLHGTQSYAKVNTHSPSHYLQQIPTTFNSNQSMVADARRPIHPVDDSLVGLSKGVFMPQDSSTLSTAYGSLLRPSRLSSMRQPYRNTCDLTNELGSRPSGLPSAEFFVNIKRQASCFGFTLVGGAEESSQVGIGAVVNGGAAQLSGLRIGDIVLSVDGVSVCGATHAEVVNLLDKAANTVGQVTLGLHRPEIENNGFDTSQVQEDIDVIIPRNDKKDAFGIVLANNKMKNNGIYITRIMPGSYASRMNLLSVGDQILAVNGVSISGLHPNEVIRLIKEIKTYVALKIRPAQTSFPRQRNVSLPVRNVVEFPITLFRGSRGFGFSIRGGQEFNRMPLLVLRIADGGAAQLDGRLKVGDELVEINGYSTIGMSHRQAIEIIQSGGSAMRLVVRRHAAYHNNSVSNGVADKYRSRFGKLYSSIGPIPNAKSVKQQQNCPNSSQQSLRKTGIFRWTIRK